MSIIIFLAVLAILILTHELGHFIFARISRVRVEEFGFGFPPRILGVKKGETLYSVNALPLGGFVKIYGENGETPTLRPEASEVGVPTPKGVGNGSFGSKPILSRALILIAGVFFNLLLAWPALTTGYLVGAPVSLENNDISGGTLSNKGVMIVQVQEDTPAQNAGLKPGDYILRLAGDGEILDILNVGAAQNFIARHASREIQISYLRGGKEFSVKATPLKNPEAGKGSLGIAMDYVGLLKLPFFRAVWQGLKTTLSLIAMTARAIFVFFVDLFTEREMLGQIAGPVGIAGIVNTASQSGFVYLLQLIALLSINLALINVIPFPALDGGRLLFLAIEFFKGKPISQKTSAIANNIGFTILIILMLLITYRDLLRLF
jgi:regulator of sigma E protease